MHARSGSARWDQRGGPRTALAASSAPCGCQNDAASVTRRASWSEVDVAQWRLRQPRARAWFAVPAERLGERVRERGVGVMRRGGGGRPRAARSRPSGRGDSGGSHGHARRPCGRRARPGRAGVFVAARTLAVSPPAATRRPGGRAHLRPDRRARGSWRAPERAGPGPPLRRGRALLRRPGGGAPPRRQRDAPALAQRRSGARAQPRCRASASITRRSSRRWRTLQPGGLGRSRPCPS